MNEFFTKQEIEEIKLFQDEFFKNLEDNFLNHIKFKYNTAEKLDQYSKIPIRQRFSLAQTLQKNLTAGVFPTAEDVERAKAIICNILLTITQDDLNNIEIITDISEKCKN